MHRYSEQGNVMFDREALVARWSGTVKAPGLKPRGRRERPEPMISPRAIDVCTSLKKLPSPPLPAWTEQHALFDGDETEVADLAGLAWGGTWEIMSVQVEGGRKVASLHAVTAEMREAIRRERNVALEGGRVECHESDMRLIDGPCLTHRYFIRHGDDMPEAVDLPPWAVPGAKFESAGFGGGGRHEYVMHEVNPVMAKIQSVGWGPPYFARTGIVLSWAKPA